MAYIITSRGAYGKTYYTGSVVKSQRFVINSNTAHKFDDIGPAKDALAEMKETLNKQIFDRCEIVEII